MASYSKTAGAFVYASILCGSASTVDSTSFERDVLYICLLCVKLAELHWKTGFQSDVEHR